MANVNVTFQEMRDAATKLDTNQQAITDELTNLQTYIKGLIGAGFVTDKASVAFGEKYDSFTTNSKELISNLNDLATYLRKAATAMSETDQQLANGL